jgi:hypothetical protein
MSMLKLVARYTRYVLTSLATIAFAGMSTNVDALDPADTAAPVRRAALARDVDAVAERTSARNAKNGPETAARRSRSNALCAP